MGSLFIEKFMIYKFTRKEIQKEIKDLYAMPYHDKFGEKLFNTLDDLLATKESKPKKELLRPSAKEQGEPKKEECKHKRCVTSVQGWEMWRCLKCGEIVEFNPTPPTPPVSEGKTVEGEIEQIKIEKLGIETLIQPFDKHVSQPQINYSFMNKINELIEAVNNLSSNAKTK